MDEVMEEFDNYCVCYLVLEESEYVEATAEAVRLHPSIETDCVPLGTPLRDVITKLQTTLGVTEVRWLSVKDRLWKRFTDHLLDAAYPKGCVVYLKFSAGARDTKMAGTYTVCYCVLDEGEYVEATAEAVRLHSTVGSCNISLETPLRDVINTIQIDLGIIMEVRWLSISDRLWKQFTDQLLDPEYMKGSIIYLKFIAKALPVTRGREVIFKVLDDFWMKLCKPGARYPNEDEYLVDYSVCKVKLPRGPDDRCPRLLWHALDKPFQSSTRIMQAAQQAVRTLIVLDNVSGSGKTRTLYEIAAAQGGIYFTGIPDSNVAAEGSGDLKAVSQKLQKLHPVAEGDIPETSAEVCIKALLISRFYLLRKMEEVGYGNPIAKLFKQVAFSLLENIYTVTDPWKALTEKLLLLIQKKSDINSLCIDFQIVLDELRGDWKGPIIFDECELINMWLPKRFGTSKGESNGSFLDILVPSLIDCKFRQIYCAGTGMSASLNSGASFHGFGGFCTVDDFKTYADTIFTTTSMIDFERVQPVFKGRYRFFVHAMEHFIASEKPVEEATNFFLSFFELTCTTDLFMCGG